MSQIRINLKGNAIFSPTIKLNGQKLKFKKGKNLTKICDVEVGEDSTVEIFKWHELESKYWLVTSLIFFIVSCFGIFDIKQDGVAWTCHYKGKLICKENANQCDITLLPFKEDEKVFKSEGECFLEDNETNKLIINKEVEKRAKILKKVKKFTWIGIIIISVLVIILLG